MVNGLKIEDRLEGASNFTSWRFRIMLTLRENDLGEFVESSVPEPEEEEEKLQWVKKDIKAMKILVDSVKDHIVPIVSKLKTARDMFKTLEEMYEINNTSRALALKQQLHHVKMAKGESVIAYFMRISDLRDQLSTIGHMVDDKDLTMLALNGLPLSWESYIQGISARSKLPKFDRLRSDCIQEESRLLARGVGQSSKNEDIHVLASHASKKKGKDGRKGFFKRNRDKGNDDAPPFKKKRDMSKIQCFRCDKFGHFVKHYPTRPKQRVTVADVDDASPQKDSSEYLFYSAFSSSVPTDTNTWLIESGASRHISSFK